MDSLSDNSNNKHLEDDMDVTAPNDLFSSNDLSDFNESAVDDQQNYLNKDIEETTGNDLNILGDDENSVAVEDTTDAEADDTVDEDTTDAEADDTVDEDTEVDEADTLDTETESNEEETIEEDAGDSLNLLGEDLDDVLSPGQQIDKTRHDDAASGEDDDQENLENLNNEGEDDDEEGDETVEKTWDMAGDDVDDDQANSSVDTLLDSGDEDVYNEDEINSDTTLNESEEASNNNDDVIGENGGYNEDGQTWNNDDDTEAELEEQEETMEQGTVEENDDDRTGSTLEQALDALEEEQESDTTPPVIVNSGELPSPSPVTDNTLSFGKYDLPVQEEIGSPTTVGQDGADDLATVDTSLLLFVAVLILVCLRLPYVKRFFVKLFRTQEPSSTLPYHTTHNKELD